MSFRSRAILLEAPYRTAWVEDDLSIPQSHDVLVRTIFSSISTGTEIAQFKGDDPVAAERPLPAKLGYENVAEVVSLGSSVVGLREGSFVVGTYGHRDFALIHAENLISITRPEPTALLLVLAADAAKGAATLGLEFNASILLTGAGAIGLLTLFNLHARGHTAVDIVEPIEDRRSLAGKFGARSLLSPDDLAQSNISYTGAFECSGNSEAFIAIQNQMKQGGKICVLSDARRIGFTLAPAFHHKELRVQGSSDGLNYNEYGPWFFANAKCYPMSEIFDQRIRFSELPSTLAAMAVGAMQPRKVLVTYDS